MLTKHDYIEKIDEYDAVKNNSVWTQTPFRDFGFKCIMNKHEFCTDLKCVFFCHQYNQELIEH